MKYRSKLLDCIRLWRLRSWWKLRRVRCRWM